MNTQSDQKVLDQLLGKVVGDVAGAMGVFMAFIGDQAGVYDARAIIGTVQQRRE